MTLVMQTCNQVMDAISLIYTVHFSHKEVQTQGKLTAMNFLLSLQSPYSFVTFVDKSQIVFLGGTNLSQVSL